MPAISPTCTSTASWRAFCCICATSPRPFASSTPMPAPAVTTCSAPEPSRSGEWRAGHRACLGGASRSWPGRAPGALSRRRGGTQPGRRLRTYPGSPLIADSLLRPQDRLIACELEPSAAALLAAAFAAIAAPRRWRSTAGPRCGAYVPPKERRGLVLIDPPFEEAADFMRLSSALAAAHRKWPTGIYLLWYPIKDRGAPDALARRLQKARRAEHSALRTDARTAAARKRPGRLRTDRGQSAVHARAGFADLHARAWRGFCRRRGQRIDWLAPSSGARAASCR